MIKKERLPFMVLAGIALITGMLAGLQRIGWVIPIKPISSYHGAIMIGGFLGTLITLEKIIPLKQKILFVIPAVSAGSVVFFFADYIMASLLLLATASVGLCAVFLVYWMREKSTIYGLMFGGAACWLAGNVVLIVTGFYPAAIPWWMAFGLLIISAERLELMKFLPVTKNQKRMFIAILSVFVASCILSFHGVGNWLSALSLMVGSIWLMRFDVLAINLRKEKLTRYTGIALLSGYCALLLTGIFMLILMNRPMGYDIIVHTFFIGFVFAMIFAHGPIILPGVLGISIKPYHRILYVWLALLHVSWMTRSVAGLVLDMSLRKYAGLFSVVAIIGYFVSLVSISIRSYRAKIV